MKIEFLAKSVTSIETELLVLGLFQGQTKCEGDLGQIDDALDGAISQLIQQGDLEGKTKQSLLIHTLGKIPAKRLLVIGLGELDAFDAHVAREAAAVALREARKMKVAHFASAAFGLEEKKFSEHAVGQAFAEGAHLANYHFEGYGLGREPAQTVVQIDLLAPSPSQELRAGVDCGRAFAVGTNLARDLVNTPGNKMTPTDMAKQAVDIATRYSMQHEVLERADMERIGMGALLAVGQGSVEPPKMIVIKYQGKDTWDDVVGFVGKGITFDTGGISIKPSAKMDEMKTDMGGGATVLGAMEVIGQLRPKVNIVAVVASAENMPSGSAFKPGDVVQAMNGKTIEVVDTDAEGRLVLADGVAYAQKLGATKVIDLATLTGAVTIALGSVASGALTNNADFLAEFMTSAKSVGEKVWELPAFDEYKEQIKTPIADVKNIGGRLAGAITAGLFVGAFIEDTTSWIHLDIAGTAYTDNDSPSTPKGATGVMVRSLAQFAKQYADSGR